MSDESGYTLTELMVGVALSLVVLTGVLGVVGVALDQQNAVAKRVAANQRGRPVMQRIINDLHSGCVAPGVAPVRAGSSGASLRFMSRSGSAVGPTPDLHVVTLAGAALSESIYPATGGAAPTWTFAAAPSSARVLLRGVGAGQLGEPAASVPTFRYYEYIGGQVSSTPLPTPLTETSAARTVQVDVAFGVYPANIAPADPKASITLSDSASLRTEPASEDSAQVNLPCR